MVVDHVQRHLSAAHRPLDESHNGELGFIEHEFVAGCLRQLAKDDKGIGGIFRLVGGQGSDGVVRIEKERLPALHARRIQRIGHMPLVQYGRAQGLQAIVEISLTRIIVGTPGGDDVNGLARRRA